MFCTETDVRGLKDWGFEMEPVVCDYCGAEKSEVSFMIGASLDATDWVLWEGTGKYSCPDCYDRGKAESKSVIQSL